jgi:hypothetical protein
MITGEIDLNNLTLNSCVERICDECGKKETTKVRCVKAGRAKRSAKIDLCWGCSQNKKYRKIPTGENNAHWRNGITVNGYKRVYDSDKGYRVLEHVYVMERFLKRKMMKNEHVHHIDLNKLNCNVENLHICNKCSGHHLIHSSLQKCGYSLFKSGKIYFDQSKKTYTRERNVFVQVINLTEVQLAEVNKYKTYIQKNRGREIEVCSLSYKKNGKWVNRNKPKHIIIGELFLGRRLFYNESTHHLDGDSTNNNLNNLVFMSNSEHRLSHSSLEKVSASFLEEGLIVFNKEKGLYQISI